MHLDDLHALVRDHAGDFLLEKIHDAKTTRTVRFAHRVEPPVDTTDLPDVRGLRDFYDTFGSLVLYHDDASGDAARHIASPDAWPQLHAGFSDWLDGIDEDELEEMAPAWVGTCLVVGETPASGNYILVPVDGDDAGKVFEFDHDGFEFTERGEDLADYIRRLLTPDGARLTDLASHMRFTGGDWSVQWWIRELRDDRGHAARTRD